MNFQEFKEKYQHREVEEYTNKVQDNPLVSVCVQTYQHVSYIKECLDGILMQKADFPFEILLGEDNSTDGTREICLEYANKYPDKIRLFLHHRENNIQISGNPTGRFNFLYNLFSGKGKYIAMCEGDDYWIDPLKLQKQVNALEKTPHVKICSHSSIKYDEARKKNISIIGKHGNQSNIISTEEVIERFGYVCPMQSIVIRNTDVEKYTQLVLNTFGAHGIMQVFWAHPYGVIYLPEAMAVYRVNSANSLTKNILNSKKHYLKAINRRLENFDMLDRYYNFIYTKAFSNSKKVNLHRIVSSSLVSFKEKLDVIKNHENYFTKSKTSQLLLNSFFSDVKRRIKNILSN